jgi:hypothetical protein
MYNENITRIESFFIRTIQRGGNLYRLHAIVWE